MDIRVVRSNSHKAGCTLTSLGLAKQHLDNDETVYYLSYSPEQVESIQQSITESSFTCQVATQCNYKDLLDSNFDVLVIDLGCDNKIDPEVLNSVTENIYVHDCSLGLDLNIAEIHEYPGSIVLLNKIPLYKTEQLKSHMDLLEQNDIAVLSKIYEDRYLNGLAFVEIIDVIQGHLVDESVDEEPYVERFLIGGNIMDSGEGYFGRYSNQAVITRGGRPDIHMSSIMNGTKCLILTGLVDPTEYIVSEARKHRVPMIQVESSTEATVNMLSGAFGDNPVRIERVHRFAKLLVGD